MALDTRYLYVVMMDVDPAREAEFNQTYDHEHIPALLKVSGVLSAKRYQTSAAGEPKYVAIYELASPEIPSSEAFRQAAESGAWPHQIRPHTMNRHRIVYTEIPPQG
jgi:hypothetical protein